MDKIQKSLVLDNYREVLPVKDKLYIHSSVVNQKYDEAVLHALVRCPCITDLDTIVEKLESHKMGPVFSRVHCKDRPVSFF